MTLVHGGRRVKATCRDVPQWLPMFELRDDNTDTWAHGVDRFDGEVTGLVTWRKPRRIESGALLEAWQVEGTIGRSTLQAEWRFYATERFCELRLKVDWREEHQVLRLLAMPSARICDHRDGIPGTCLRREADGKERPLRDYVVLRLANNAEAAIVCPDIFSVSVTPQWAALTLLRSCVMAHHEPHDGKLARRQFCDRGEHTFRFRFLIEGTVTTIDEIEDISGAMADPIRKGDLTVGMPLRALRGKLQPGLWHPKAK